MFLYTTPQRPGHLAAPSSSSSTLALASRDIAAAPALALDVLEADRMKLTNAELIAEAIAINHREVAPRTLAKYRKHLDHLDEYLSSAHGVTLLEAKRKHLRLFMEHLKRPGGAKPDGLRLPCSWCAAHNYPDTADGGGWSASTRKSYLSAVRFLYTHCMEDEELPDLDPTTRMKSAKVETTIGYTPTVEEVKLLLDVRGRPRDTLLAYWLYFAPSRRETYARARWRDIDLDAGVWHIPTGKNGTFDSFALNPLLSAQLRRYRDWQLREAQRNQLMRHALTNPDTAYVLLTRTGRPMTGQTIAKLIQWRAIRAGVGVVAAPRGRDGQPRRDCPGGKTTRLTPHALRRAWATHALNDPDPKKRVPIEVVSKVLNHKDISTTRRHYAPTKGELADDALMRRWVA